MPHLPELADRVWYAIHCLPRNAEGKPPTYKDLEKAFDLPHAVLSKTVLGDRKEYLRATMKKMALVFLPGFAPGTEPNDVLDWLEAGGKGGPRRTGVVPPRPGRAWICHGELATWRDGVLAALPARQCPSAAFRAGAELPVYQPIDRVTAQIAIGVSWYAWAMCDEDEQAFYSTEEAKTAYAGDKRPRSITSQMMRIASKAK